VTPEHLVELSYIEQALRTAVPAVA